MKKILMITPYFAPAWGYGGPPRVNFDLAKYLVKTGNEVTVLTTDVLDGNSRCKIAKENIEGITVLRFKNLSNWLAWNFKLFIPLKFAGYARKHIKDFDFVFLSDCRDFQNAIAYKICLKHKIPYSISAYGQLRIEKGIKGKIKKAYDFIWGKESLKKASWLFAQTENEIKDYLSFGAERNQCKILPLGINKGDFGSSKDDNFKQRYNIPSNAKIILFIGRINYLKGIDLLVENMPEIIKEVPNAQLVIIGRDDGYYLKELKKLIAELKLIKKVKILGPIYGKDNYTAYRSAEIFAFTPRYYEETSLACLASLALGTPVLTVHQSSIPYLEKYNAGYEIDLDQKEITKRLISLLKDDNLIKSMGKNGKKLIADIFDLPKVGKVLEGSIKEALEEKRND